MSESQERKHRKRLAPSQKYEMFVQILTQQATQREAAASWGVDRTTVVHVCRVAKHGALAASVPGRPGGAGATAERAELDAARAEIERLRATVTEQAVVLHLHQGRSRCVVDTSRSGNSRVPGETVDGGPTFCNPPGRALGQAPTQSIGDRSSTRTCGSSGSGSRTARAGRGSPRPGCGGRSTRWGWRRAPRPGDRDIPIRS